MPIKFPQNTNKNKENIRGKKREPFLPILA